MILSICLFIALSLDSYQFLSAPSILSFLGLLKDSLWCFVRLKGSWRWRLFLQTQYFLSTVWCVWNTNFRTTFKQTTIELMSSSAATFHSLSASSFEKRRKRYKEERMLSFWHWFLRADALSFLQKDNKLTTNAMTSSERRTGDQGNCRFILTLTAMNEVDTTHTLNDNKDEMKKVDKWKQLCAETFEEERQMMIKFHCLPSMTITVTMMIISMMVTFLLLLLMDDNRNVLHDRDMFDNRFVLDYFLVDNLLGLVMFFISIISFVVIFGIRFVGIRVEDEHQAKKWNNQYQRKLHDKFKYWNQSISRTFNGLDKLLLSPFMPRRESKYQTTALIIDFRK